MKKPLKLFGNEYKEEQVRFIHIDGIGYWFLSRNNRLAGERDALRVVSKKSQKSLWTRSWLIVQIVTENQAELTKELYEQNPTKLSDQEIEETKQDDKKLKQALEELVRNSLSNTDLLYHPVIKKYNDRFTELFLEDDSEYQDAVTLSAFAHRLIIDDEHIAVNIKDPEKGIIPAEKVFTGVVRIGEQITKEDLKQLDEILLNNIYDFCIGEFNGETWQTTKDKEKSSQSTELVEPVVETDEKKPDPVLTSSVI